MPTLAESLPLPGYVVDSWFGVLAAAGTPCPIVDRLNAEINRIIRDPQFAKEKLAAESFIPVGTTPERYLDTMKTDIAKYAKIVQDAKIPPFEVRLSNLVTTVRAELVETCYRLSG